jgi:cysteinyl-tRNA synthetase
VHEAEQGGARLRRVEIVIERVAARDKARQAKDFSAADRIRAELKAQGVEIEDGAAGTTWRRV